MIAYRFRAMGWAVGAMSAATGLYLISLQVAAERGRLEAVEHRIARARHDVLALQTEFGTRASMRQLEKWNGNVLALSTPKAVQFLRGEVQLASLDASILDGGKLGQAPKVVMASASSPLAPAPAPAPPATKPTDEARLRYATYTKPSTPPRAEKAAVLGSPPLLRQASLSVAAKASVVQPARLAKPLPEAKPKPNGRGFIATAAAASGRASATATIAAKKLTVKPPVAVAGKAEERTSAKALTPAVRKPVSRAATLVPAPEKPLLKAGTLARLKSAAAKEERKR